MKKLLLFLFSVVLSLQFAQGQTLDAWVEAGDEAFEHKDFYTAYQYYGIALEYKDEQPDVWYNYAESARQFNIYTKAEEAYQRVLGFESNQDYPLAAYWLAKVKQKLGSYGEAVVFFEKFLEEQEHVGQKYIEDAEKGIEDSRWANDVVNNAEDIDILNMTDKVNSPYSDFGVAWKGDTMYFSSLKYVYNKDTINPPRPFSKILQLTGEENAKLLPKEINTKGKHVAHTAFNSDFSKVYYTICDYVTQTEIQCNIFVSSISTEGHWSPAEKLSINAPGFSTTQPNVGYDRYTQKEILYFSSDRPGGKGEMDIWKSEIKADGSLGVPSDLEDINTENNEVTPFYHVSSQTLYFSSEGYQGLGSYDIYKSKKNADTWGLPQHLGSPVNSGYEDLYYSMYDEKSKVYFASNRPDSAAIFWDETKEACCYDIYTYDKKLTVDLLVLTFNNLDQSELIDAKVELYEITETGEEILIDSLTNPTGNNFSFSLQQGMKYKIKSTKNGFSTDTKTVDLNAPELEGLTSIERKLYMEPGINLDVLTFDNIDSLALDGVTVELYELTSAGEVLVDAKTNDGGNDFTFPLKRGKKYIIKAKKPGFPTVVEPVDLTDPTLATASKIEKKLYLGQELEVLTFDDRTRKELDGATIELLEILPDGKTILRVKKFNPDANNFLFPLDLSKKYKIHVERTGYEPLTQNIDFDPEVVKNAGGRITIEVYLKRNGLDDFLPVTLYFDNDYPDPRSGKTTTKAEYMSTNESYLKRKEEFIDEFTEGLSENDKFVTGRRFKQFFDLEVKRAQLDLRDFTTEMYALLESGQSFTITLRGYASPRASTRYNQILSKRRINSVLNYFSLFEKGALTKYMNDGRLIVKEDPLGESTADISRISDKLEDKKGSIYSMVASIERRVEIVDVESR